MILFDMLQAKQKRVVLEKISIVRRSACWAPAVMLKKYMILGIGEKTGRHRPVGFV